MPKNSTPQQTEASPNALEIRAAGRGDVAAVIALDRKITGMDKPNYWSDLYDRYGDRKGRYFLVAEAAGGAGDGRQVVGFIIGEIRAWEFGSPPSGWVFAIGVDPETRLKRVGTKLFHSICDRLRAAGVDTVRTMLARDDELNMTFFRSQGMMGGPFIQLEMELG
ncbi:MAG: GNAT family N-acetyltransferase [Alphaproteobacteria bacterium]|nr:GNAT family N-acetyltransferase [Alphaproteobacteria bacterium]